MYCLARVTSPRRSGHADFRPPLSGGSSNGWLRPAARERKVVREVPPATADTARGAWHQSLNSDAPGTLQARSVGRSLWWHTHHNQRSSMTTTKDKTHTRELTIDLAPDEANAVMRSICMALTQEGANLSNEYYDCPGRIHDLSVRANRIGAFALVGGALRWRSHWGPIGGTPGPVTAPEAVWLDLLAELNDDAEAVRRDSEAEPEDMFEFDKAARTVARAFSGAEAVAV